MFFGKSKGQGTIEYLVILAVIVVVSLIVVSLLINSTSGAEGISSGTSKIGGWTNTISVTESAISPDGNYLVRLANNTGEPLTIKTVSVGNEEVSFSEDLFQGSQQGFKVSSEVICEIGQTITADLVITYVSQNGLEHTETFPADIAFACDDYVVSLLANQCETCVTYDTQYLSPNSTILTEGYYDANNLATISDGNLAEENILDTATIFGITGTASAGGGGVEADFHFSETKDYFVRNSVGSDGNYTVSDPKNGLIWQDGIKGGNDTQANAITYCTDLDWADHEDWRLPSVYELYTLVDVNSYVVGVKENYFPSVFQTVGATSAYGMWSSTTVPSDIDVAYYLDSVIGTFYDSDKTSPFGIGVRCVRSE